MSKIKVLLVEDSPVAVGMFKKMLESSPDIEVVGTASDGNQALTLIPKVQPQVMCTDLQMPNMDGFELIKQVMAKYPLPVLVLSNAVQKDDIDNIFKVLQDGALDVMAKPQAGLGDNQEALQRTLITKIKVLATKKVAAKPL
ncbi:response regulator [Crocosphaera chwakensis]|uniref:Response regulator receiver (CheY-like) modulated CheB methylesterase n=1 Tax=Crocosphaera chwakensis CCY0110 TaxID=391612 RepID=A3IYC3_9CHRO|nr:response regulator [Crocosphaera chwakensis]EAZ88531.1 response regulator receiver (CheY-like) modulated CheB methylesterase [Crocosphaera chwakensis CCY0110]